MKIENRKSKLAALALFLVSSFYFPLSAAAQSTTVTGQVIDLNGVPYANAQLKAQLVTTTGSPVSGQPTVTNTSAASCAQAGFGSAPCQIPFQGTFGPTSLDASGNFPAGGIQLQDNSQVTPSGTQWLFTISETGTPPPLGTGPQVCSAQLAITGGSVSVSSSFNACPALSNVVPGGAAGKGFWVGMLDPTQAPYNVRADAIDFDDGSVTSGSNLLNSPTLNCSSAYIGKTVTVISNAGGSPPSGTYATPVTSPPPTITGCNSATQATMSANSSITLSGTAEWIIGTDSGAGAAAALTYGWQHGYMIAWPCGTILTSTPINYTGPAVNPGANGFWNAGCGGTRFTRFGMLPQIMASLSPTSPILFFSPPGTTTGIQATSGIDTNWGLSNLQFTSFGGCLPQPGTAGSYNMVSARYHTGLQFFQIALANGSNGLSLIGNGSGENYGDRLNAQNFGNIGCSTASIIMHNLSAGQGANVAAHGVYALGGTAVSCGAGALCDLDHLYIAQASQAVSFGGAGAKLNVLNSSITGIYSGVAADGIADNGAETINVEGSHFSDIAAGAYSNIRCTNAGTVINVRNTDFNTSGGHNAIDGTAACTYNDGGGNTGDTVGAGLVVNHAIFSQGAVTPGHVATFIDNKHIQDGGPFTATPNVNVYFHSQNLAANVGASATTQTTIDSFTLPALPAACGTNGCRIRVGYSYYIFGGTYGMCWISDGTNLWGGAYFDTNTNFSLCSTGSLLSPVTYSSGATPTISIRGIDGGTWTACTSTSGAASPCTTTPTNSPAIPSQFQVEVVTSN